MEQREKSKNGKPISTAAEIFEMHAVKSDGCWEWSGYRNPAGYGQTRVGGRGAKAILAHRLSWTIHHGGIPEGMHVLHRCDNPSCVNPEHLFLGTNEDNIADRVAKGRPGGMAVPGARKIIGEKNPNAKLSADDLKEIVRLRKSGSRVVDIARRYGISKEHTSRICTGKVRVGQW